MKSTIKSTIFYPNRGSSDLHGHTVLLVKLVFLSQLWLRAEASLITKAVTQPSADMVHTTVTYLTEINSLVLLTQLLSALSSS
jgi:hypothetical protein